MSTRPDTEISLDSLLAHTHDGVFVLDSDRRYILFNRGCERITGYSSEEVMGGSCGCVGITDCQDEQSRSLRGSLCPGLSVFRGEKPYARARLQIGTKSGEQRWVETTYTSMVDPDGRTEYVIGVMRDISDHKQREDQRAETIEQLREEANRLRQHMRERYGFGGIVSRSPAMQVVFEKIQSACSNSAPVLITGENGTGKEMVARTIHFNGLQKDGPFVPMTCTAASREMMEGELFGYIRGSFAGASQDYPGLFRAADGGTLLLEEISALPGPTQAKLLRAMQDRTISPVGSIEQQPANVRVIAASNRSTNELVSSGKLREDLYYRLSVITIDLPPLRMRKEDIPFLVDHFISEFNQHGTRQVKEVDPGVWSVLDGHDWPGNVRELQNTVETALVTGSGDKLRVDEVESAIRGRRGMRDADMGSSPIKLDDMLADIERRTILGALRRTRGQRSLAAKMMGISRSRLYRRMDALGIVPRDEKL